MRNIFIILALLLSHAGCVKSLDGAPEVVFADDEAGQGGRHDSGSLTGAPGEIAALEEKRTLLEAEMTRVSDERRVARLVELAREHEALQGQLGEHYKEWTGLAEELETD